MEREEENELWNKVFGFRVGDRVKYYLEGRKTPLYGDIVDIDNRYEAPNRPLLYIRLASGIIVLAFATEITKVKRRKR